MAVEGENALLVDPDLDGRHHRGAAPPGARSTSCARGWPRAAARRHRAPPARGRRRGLGARRRCGLDRRRRGARGSTSRSTVSWTAPARRAAAARPRAAVGARPLVGQLERRPDRLAERRPPSSVATSAGSPSSRASRSASNGPPEGTVASRAPSASASSGAWPKSSQRAPAASTRAPECGRGTRPPRPSAQLEAAGSGTPVRRRCERAQSGSSPYTSSRHRAAAGRPARHEHVETLGLGVGDVGDRDLLALVAAAPRELTGGGTTTAGAEPAGSSARPPAPAEGQPRAPEAAPLEHVQDARCARRGGSSAPARRAGPRTASGCVAAPSPPWSRRSRSRAARGGRGPSSAPAARVHLDQVVDRVAAPQTAGEPEATPPPRSARRPARSCSRNSRSACRQPRVVPSETSRTSASSASAGDLLERAQIAVDHRVAVEALALAPAAGLAHCGGRARDPPASSTSALAAASPSPGSTRKPVSPSSTASAVPPTFVATTGRPSAIASSTLIGSASASLVRQTAPAARISSSASVRTPSSSTPLPLGQRAEPLRPRGPHRLRSR